MGIFEKRAANPSLRASTLVATHRGTICRYLSSEVEQKDQSIATKMLCDFCHYAFRCRVVHGREVRHQSIAGVRASAAKHCQICDSVVFALKDQTLHPTAYTVFFPEERYEQDNGDCDYFSLRVLLRDANTIDHEKTFHVVGTVIAEFWLVSAKGRHSIWIIRLCIHTDGLRVMRDGLQNYKPSSVSTLSEDGLHLVESWMDNCVRNHPKCQQGTEDAWVPARLVHVGQCGKSGIHIEVFPDHIGTAPYLTLSHCWGTPDIFKLKQANLEAMQANIPFESLPRTFQDAIAVTANLGFQYIWIDSLCIIQDSSEDWVNESALMGKIYQNSRLNLGATASKDSFGGLSCLRDPSTIQPTVVKILYQRALKWNQSLLKWTTETSDIVPKDYYVIDDRPSFKSRYLDEAPLHRRAWVFQERLLSARMIHFAQDQLYWECRHLEACETYPDGLPETTYLGTPLTKDVLVRGKTDIETGTSLSDFDHEARQVHWSYIVETFTRGALSNLSDKLVAISAVARQMQRLLRGDEYLAGMWRKSLRREILWKVAGQGSYRPSGIYRAPTWCWTSVEGAISYHVCWQKPRSLTHTSERILADVMSASVDGANIMQGQVRQGSLTLRGRLFVARLVRKVSANATNSQHIALEDMKPCAGANATEPVVVQDPDPASLYSDVTATLDDSTLSPETIGEVFLLPVFAYTYRLLEHDPDEGPSIQGLILVRAGDSTFHRLGLFELTHKSVDEGMLQLPSLYCYDVRIL
ncbi:hypothetical protein LTR47_006383 [Exophiala xenobiotica]|nr:hypothetical protein LTR41_007464 [Exophiala xenobiotica]KAK5232496.1 hypothetical protein LTR47_006383 [Exophiala xenobiotica]KAK5251611.1 hypothetical protein LTS06_003754 [Exophiala xenobiotica]KAK5283772.1 hypothetical protein LTR40_001263 [Exophiala xenobiotica]KAK5368291.1 hypothetical protein LTR11_007628 [Exophiala xenobiotica]